MIIEMQDVSKKFGRIYGIKDINLAVTQQETTCIIGPSGSGKTTLIRCINYLERPTSGHIIINGKKLTERNAAKLCLKIGMVFQHFNLFPHFTVLENLIYAPMQVLGMTYEQARAKAEDLLKEFDLKEKIDVMPAKLSGGQKQRAAIVRSLMMDPEIILFDEPTSALDPEIVRSVTELIIALKSKATIFVVSHHITFAKNIADRVIFMDKGLILADQPADKFFEKPASQRARLFLENTEGYC